MTPLECGIIFDGIPEGAISRKVGLIWGIPAKTALAQPEDPEEKMESDLSRTESLAAVGKFVWPIPDRGLTKRIHRITMPALLLWGDSDGMVPLDYGKEFQRLLPNSSLKVIDRCGHFPQEERPEEVFDAVLAFLQHRSRPGVGDRPRTIPSNRLSQG